MRKSATASTAPGSSQAGTRCPARYRARSTMSVILSLGVNAPREGRWWRKAQARKNRAQNEPTANTVQ